MDDGNKKAFWAVVAASFLLVCVPTAVLFDALAGYRRYLGGLQRGALRPVKMRLIPHRDGRREEPRAPLDFVEFSVRKPKAKKVALIGDFNGWKDGSLPMSRSGDGLWQLALPLPKGRHYYLFVVDGKAELDAANPESGESAGRKASVRTIK